MNKSIDETHVTKAQCAKVLQPPQIHFLFLSDAQKSMYSKAATAFTCKYQIIREDLYRIKGFFYFGEH